MRSELHRNTGQYARFIIRRERIGLPAWVLPLVAITLVVALAYTQLASTGQDRLVMAETMKNPAVTAMFGPGYGLDNYHYGAIMGHQMLLFTALLVAAMSILLTVRHTRGDEEYGRFELIRSLPVGRLTSLSSTALVVTSACLVIGLATGLGLSLLGLEGVDLSGSLLYGAALAVTGVFFMAVAALCAQLSETSRGATGLSFAMLGLSYIVRAIGDVGNEALSWFSPLGWIVRIQVYVNNYWWPLLLTVGVGVVVFVGALRLSSVRDMGAGIIPVRPGRRYASAMLQSPFGLALRLQRGALIAWAATVFVLGASYGSVLGDLESYLQSMDMIRNMLIEAEGFSLTDQFLPMLLAVMTMTSAIPVLLMALKVRAEETRNRTEHLLSRSVSRGQVLGSYMVLSFAASVVMVLLAVLGMWSAAAATMAEPVPLSRIMQAGFTYVPALWVMSGLAALVVGFAPQATSFMWLYLGFSFFVVYMGPILQIPAWIAKLSPFGHIPKLPIEEANFAIYTILAAIAMALTVAGFRAYQQRDIQG